MKILASDFDGTLTHSSQHGILDKDVETIQAWQEAGNLFGVVTGRDLKGVEVGLMDSGLVPDFVIGLNGAIIMVGDKEIQHLGIDDTIAEDIESLILKYKEGVCYSTKNNGRASKKLVYDPKHWVSEHFDERSNYVDDVSNVTNFIVSTYDEPTALKIDAEMKERFADAAAPHRSSGNFIDIVAPNIHKADALEVIVDHFNVEDEDVIVVGDSYNDIEMIQRYKGFAVHNANSEIRDLAYGVVNDFEDLLNQAAQRV